MTLVYWIAAVSAGPSGPPPLITAVLQLRMLYSTANP